MGYSKPSHQNNQRLLKKCH